MNPRSRWRLLWSTLFLARLASSQSCPDQPTVSLTLGNCTFSQANETGSVYSWGVLLGVGNSTEVCGMVSTVVNSSLIQSSEICTGEWLKGTTEAQCRSRRGGYVTRTDFPPAPIDGLAALNPGWVGLMQIDAPAPFQYAASVALQLRDRAVGLVVGLITQGQESSSSHVGLAEQSTLLQSLRDAGMIAARSWGLNAGSQSYLFPRPGNLVLGGRDEASIDGPLHTFAIASPDILNKRPCPLQVTISEMTLTLRNTSQVYVDASNKLPVCIEPYDNLFRMPNAILQQITAQFRTIIPAAQGPVPVSNYSSRLYNLEPGLVYPSSAGELDPTLRIALLNGPTITVPTHELVRPLRGLDPNGVAVADTRFNEVQIYGDPAPEDGPVMGKTFLSQLYLFVDYESMTFSLAKQSLEATSPQPKSSASCPAQGGLSKTDKGLIAVGAVLAALILVLAWLLIRRRRRGAGEKADDSGTAGAQNGANSHGTPLPSPRVPQVSQVGHNVSGPGAGLNTR